MVRVRIGDELHELTWEEWETRVRSGRIPDDAEVQFEAVTGHAFVRAADLEMYRSLRNDAAIEWRGRFLAGPAPLLTALLVGVQVRIWWFAQVPDLRGHWVHRLTNWTAPTLENAEVWRPLTMGLLHTHPLHIVLNMLWLAYCGWNLERALGRANLLTLYVASVLGGSLLSMFGSPNSQSLGASGGVFGLVAASVAFGFARPELLPRRGRRLFGAAMLPYLLLMFWSGLMSEDTDNWSHLGGLLTGGVLALLLDPEPLQRRPGWNRRARAAVVAAVAGVLLVLGVAGPRLHPLVDADEARIAFLPTRRQAAARLDPDRYRSLEWSVPVGWRPGSVLATAGFASPTPNRSVRAFGVRERSDDRLWTTAELADAWADEVREDWPAAEIGSATPDAIAGHDGLHRVARMGFGTEARSIEWWGVARGTWLLEVEWQVDEASSHRLAPLRDRLLTRVTWRDPADLEQARQDVAYLSSSPKARIALAHELTRIGDVEGAFALYDGLVAEAPEDPYRWKAALEAVALATPPVDVAEDWWRRALDAVPVPLVVVAVAEGLDASGRPQDAIGLMQVAWDEAPGDRQLRRARRRRGLPVELDPATGAPWDLIFDPVTGEPRREADTMERQRRGPSLEAARAAGIELAKENEAVTAAAVAAIRAGDTGRVAPLLVLKDGFVPGASTDALVALVDDLERVAEGRGPARWMPAEVEAALLTNRGFTEALREALPQNGI